MYGFKSRFQHHIEWWYEIWTFFLECPESIPSFLPENVGFAGVFAGHTYASIVAIEKLKNQIWLNKNWNNSFWTPLSSFIIRFSYLKPWIHKHSESYNLMYDVDVPYYRSRCICQRRFWIPLRSDNSSDRVLLSSVWRKRIPLPRCGTAFRWERKIALLLVS